MSALTSQFVLTFRWAIKDRIFYAVLGVALCMLLLVPVFSAFSMRQVQELSITLSLSVISFLLVVMAILLGTSVLWREIERRYILSVLSLPISRSSYLVGKFIGVVGVLLVCTLMIGVISVLVILIATSTYPSQVPINWGIFALALFFEFLKAVLVAAVALFFTSVATSFYLPFFATFGVYLAGSASQEVSEYLTSQTGASFPTVAKGIAEFFYYVIPNFGAFDLKVYAIYALPLPQFGLLLTVGYFVFYCLALIAVTLWCFNRRQRI